MVYVTYLSGDDDPSIYTSSDAIWAISDVTRLSTCFSRVVYDQTEDPVEKVVRGLFGLTKLTNRSRVAYCTSRWDVVLIQDEVIFCTSLNAEDHDFVPVTRDVDVSSFCTDRAVISFREIFFYSKDHISLEDN